MRYRNVKNGAVIEAKSVLGGDWMPIDAPKKTGKAEKAAPKKGKAKK